MKRLLLLVLVLLFVMPSMVGAQDPEITADNAIEFNKPVSGEITGREFEVEYGFIGKAGDVIVSLMVATEDNSQLTYPSLLLLDPDFNVVADTNGYASTVLAAQLETDGEYTLLATRKDGRAGESIGLFEVTLVQAPSLVGSAAEGTILNQTLAFYSIQTEEEFSLNYTRTGDFYPLVSLMTINDGVLTAFATLDGRIDGGSLVISPADIGAELMVVRVSEPDYFYSSKVVSADYTLAVETVEDK